MEKRFAYLIALAITLIIATTHFSITGNLIQNSELIEIKRVIDGDTLIDNQDRTIRLLNINAPEKNQPTSIEATNFLKDLQNKTLQLQITGQDKYQRLLGRIYHNDQYINLQLVKEGLASKFLVDESELSLFNEAEELAVKNQKGIWKISQYWSCITTSIDEKEEIVLIENSCPEISFSSWFLKDESRKIYTFKNIKLNKIQLHSTKGEENETDLFWQSSTNVWNNDRDTLYLFDSSGNIVNHNSYNY